MWLKLGALLLLAVIAITNGNNTASNPAAGTVSRKVLCYYEGSTALREGLGKSIVADIEPALSICTHLIYGYAGINPDNYNVRSVNEQLDLDSGKGQFRLVTDLKRRYPALKVLLGVGFFKDPTDEKTADKYLTLLESGGSRTAFINSLYGLVKSYNFDGVDLAWQFRQTKPKKIRGVGGSLWHGFKKVFSGDSVLDPKADEHKEAFTVLIRDIRNTFAHDRYQLGLTVLPHVNETMFMDAFLLKDNVEYVHLASFDQQTPERNPSEADFNAPLYEPTGDGERVAMNNIDAEVHHWLTAKTPANKIVVGIASYGRGWKLPDDSGPVPPVVVDGPSPAGPYTNVTGRYSYAEICTQLTGSRLSTLDGAAPLQKQGDPKKAGVYAYRVKDKKKKIKGMWVSYESPESAAEKGAYVKAKGLGGISIFDLSNDDVRGLCTDVKFPILKAAKNML